MVCVSVISYFGCLQTKFSLTRSCWPIFVLVDNGTGHGPSIPISSVRTSDTISCDFVWRMPLCNGRYCIMFLFLFL